MKVETRKIQKSKRSADIPKGKLLKSTNRKLDRHAIKSVLITQPKPENDKNPYADLAKKYNLTIDFKPFIYLEAVSAKEFRRLKINPEDFKSVIFTSRNTVDQYFKLCDELRSKISPDGKYYCMTEAIALYLQKYILYRKRKVFFADGTFNGLFEIIEKHRDGEKYLIPCSDNHKSDIADYLRMKKYEFAEAVIFNTVPVKLKEKELYGYDLIVFFTPAGVNALMSNFANFKQKNIKFGAFGPLTAQAVLSSNLTLDLQAPTPGIPSMSMAIDEHLKKLI